jgi:menaquinone-dependent protoporphyrinogen oxidase
MSGSVLVAYATKKGSTREVAEAIARTLGGEGLAVSTRPAAEVRDVSDFRGVVLGGALYMGRWHPEARRFLRRHRQALAELPFAVFGMGPLTSEEHDLAGSRAQLDRALGSVPELEPVALAVFGGVLDPTKQHFPFSRMKASDARDWEEIHAWALEVAGSFVQAEAPYAVRP